MAEDYPGMEKREFYRYIHETPIHYRVIISSKDKKQASKLIKAISRNLSASGILFTSKHLPELSSIVMLDLDYRTTQICKEIESNGMIVNDKLFGKAVRIEDNNDGTYDIGVAFIKKSDNLPEDIKKLAHSF